MATQRKYPGIFITFEGGEGAGKSTQIRHLIHWLKKEGFSVVFTLEPGGTEIGEKIREILLNPANKGLCPRAELLLYEADRAQHVESLIFPALRAGKIVVSDRFSDSSTVYQGIGRKLGVPAVEKLNHFATQGLTPDLCVLLDIPESIGLARVRQRVREDLLLQGVRRKVKLDRLENEKALFHRRIRKGFLTLARQYPRRFCVINASQSEDKIKEILLREVKARLIKRKLWRPQT